MIAPSYTIKPMAGTKLTPARHAAVKSAKHIRGLKRVPYAELMRQGILPTKKKKKGDKK